MLCKITEAAKWQSHVCIWGLLPGPREQPSSVLHVSQAASSWNSHQPPYSPPGLPSESSLPAAAKVVFQHAGMIVPLLCSELASSSSWCPGESLGLLSMVDQAPHNQVQAYLLGFLYHCSWTLPCLVPSISTELLVVPRVPWGSSCLPDFAYAVPSI